MGLYGSPYDNLGKAVGAGLAGLAGLVAAEPIFSQSTSSKMPELVVQFLLQE